MCLVLILDQGKIDPIRFTEIWIKAERLAESLKTMIINLFGITAN